MYDLGKLNGPFKEFVDVYGMETREDRRELTGDSILRYFIDTLLDHEVPKSEILKIQVFFHSQNPIGCQNMKGRWGSFIKFVKENL